MRLLFRLLLTIMSFMLVLALFWLSLPGLLESVLRSQMTQQGFSVSEIVIGQVGLQSTTVERLQMSNEQVEINLQGLQADYQFSDLISGSVLSLHTDLVRVSRKPDESHGPALPDPMLLLSLLNTRWDEYLPARSVVIDEFSLYDENGGLSLNSSVNIFKQGKSVSGKIWLVDRNSVEYLLSLEISPESVADLQLHSGNEGEKNPLSITATPAKGGNGLTGQANADLREIAGLFSEIDGLSGQLQSEFSYLAQPDSADRRFVMQATMIDASMAGWQVNNITAALQGSLSGTDNGFRLEIDDSSLITADTLSQAASRIKKLVIKPPQVIELVDEGVRISSESGASITLGNAIHDNITVPHLEVSNIALSSPSQGHSPAACTFGMQLNGPAVEIDDLQIKAEPVLIKGDCPDRKKSQWAVNASVAFLNVEDNDFQLQLNNCKTDVSTVTDQSVSVFAGELLCQSSSQGGEVQSSFRFDTDNGTGRAAYSSPDIHPDNEAPLFSSLLKDWKEPYDIVSGNLSISGEYRWWKSSKGQHREKLNMNLNLREAGGFYEGILFSGLNYKDSIDILPAIKSADFAELSVRNIDIGIPVEETSVLLNYSDTKNGDLPLLTMNKLSLSLLGGKVVGNDVDIDLNSDTHSMVLVVVGLDLAQIVALQQVEGLSATGLIDGYVPITITSEGVKITDGKIVSQPQGGKINYAPAGGTVEIEKSAIGSEFVFRIIQDLNYDSLVIDVNYDESGEMEMMLALKGMSPKVDKNRPVHFNLNLQQNVLKLLRGLRYAEGLSEDIDRNVQKYFRKQKNPVN